MATPLDTYGPYDSGPGASITENTWRKIMSNSLNGGSGVLQGITNAFEVFGDSTGLQVKVKTGECWIRGAWGESTAQKTLPIATAPTTASHTRKDRVVLRNDFVNNRIELDVLTGTSSAGTPTIPSCTKDTTKWETSLAVVSVGNSVSTITAGNVDDQREYQGVFAKYRANDGANQDVPNNAVTKVEFPTVVTKSADVIATGTNNTDFELQRAGEWTVFVNIGWETLFADFDGTRWAFLCPSTAVTPRYASVSTRPDPADAALSGGQSFSVTERFTAGTKLSIYVYQNSGSTQRVASRDAFAPVHVAFRWNGT